MKKMENKVSILTDQQLILKVEIDSQIATAKQYPRNVVDIVKNVEALATMDKETAASCFYTKPIGNGKTASGESVRFAEIVLGMWGNTRIRTYIKEETDKSITAVAEIHDLEKNIAISSEVSRSILTKFGKQGASQIEVTKMAAQAIARRNAILTAIPKGFFVSALDKIKNASIESHKLTSQEAVIKNFNKWVVFYQKEGVAKTDILKTIAVLDDTEVAQEHLIQLQGFYTSIKEGLETYKSIFNPDLDDHNVNIDNPKIKDNEKK